ncbi:MAG: AAA family ATPase [Armatimonadota bacterium]|nr:AAA family ATPase [Armatimonadota bacterium]
MIIRKVIIKNWRAIREAEHTLHAGLNVLKGPNEAGKSSTVEAMEWALYRDIVGGARAKEDIEAIIPAHDPGARPTVELHLVFQDCTAIVTKVLAANSTQRACHLVIQQQDNPDQHFERDEAQARLKTLIEADGLAVATHGALDAGLLVSRQGEAAGYVKAELSPAVRSMLTVTDNGTIAPTSRLERVRAEVAKRRAKELFENLKSLAVSSAKKQTEAARLRDEIEALRRQCAEFQQIEDDVEALRESIARLLQEIEELKPRAEAAQTRLQELQTQRDAQQVANSEVAVRQLVYERALGARDELQRIVDDIKQLRGQHERVTGELQEAWAAHKQAQRALSEMQHAHDAALAAHEAAQARLAAARQTAEAWAHYRDVCIAKKEWKIAYQRLQDLEALEAEVQSRRAAQQALPRWAAKEQIWEWRKRFETLERLRQEAAQQLQVSFVPQRALKVEWCSDGGDWQRANTPPGEAVQLHGGQAVALRIAGIGEVQVSSADQSRHELLQQIEAGAQQLNEELAPFELTVADLPQAWDELEQQSQQGEAAIGDLKAAKEKVQAMIAAVETKEVAQQQVEACKATLDQARAACAPLRYLLPSDLAREQVNQGLQEARETIQALQHEAELVAKDWSVANQQWEEQRGQVAELNTRLQGLEATSKQITQQLVKLTKDELDDTARARQLDTLCTALWQAQAALQEAQQRRDALGAEITRDDVEAARQEALSLAAQVREKETELTKQRAVLHSKCEQDTRSEIERLRFEIEEKQAGLARHEARLRGMAILEAALEAERHRLGRTLAEPINQLLSPWLSAIRGKETCVEFDDNGQRITRVRTKEITSDGETTVSLDFSEHSGGMKEQTALALRLILAQMMARRLPGKTLPVILDDPLTQTDCARRAGLQRVLNEAAQTLQIIFVTCHEEHIDEASGHGIRLGKMPTPLVETVKPARKSAKKSETNGHHKPAVTTPSLWSDD